MPEKFPLPEIKKGPKKNGRDIAEGEITQDGRTLSWKSNEPIDKEAELLEYSLKKLKQTNKASKENGTQKSDNVIKMGDASLLRSQKYYRTRQEIVEKDKRITRRATTDLTSNEAEKYEALFNR